MRIKPVMDYHGSKYRIAQWIIDQMPPHDTYVEPFGGSAAVLIQKPRARAEVYNDLDQAVVNVMRVMRDAELNHKLQKQLALTPYSRTEFQDAVDPDMSDPVEWARCTLVRAAMGFGSASATSLTTGFKSDTVRRPKPPVLMWPDYPDRMAYFANRLRGVLIESIPAISLIARYQCQPDVLIYVDPPYPFETRTAGASYRKHYRYEMSNAEHVELLRALKETEAKVMISSYRNPIYDELLPDWQRLDKTTIGAGQSGSVTRVESLYINPTAQSAQYQTSLLDAV